MKNVQTSSRFLSQLNSERRRAQTRLFVTDKRMKTDVEVFAILSLVFSCVFTDDSLVFAVSGNKHTSFGENLSQRIHAVNQHISGTGTHEQLDAAHMLLVYQRQQIRIVVSRTKVERVVHKALAGGILKLIVKCLDGSSLRLAVGHIHERSHTTGSSGSRLGSHLRLMRKPRIAEVNMVVYHTRQQITSTGINL